MTGPDATQRYGIGSRPSGQPVPPAAAGNVILGAIFLAVLFAGLWLVVTLVGGGPAIKRGASYVAYYTDVGSAREGASVLLGGRPVGRVDSIDPGVVGVQLQIFPGRVPEVAELRTLDSARSTLWVAPGLEVRFRSDSHDVFLDLEWQKETDSTHLTLQHRRDGSWKVVGRPAAADTIIHSLMVNGGWRALVAGDTLFPGDLLLLGNAGVQLNRLVNLTRVRISLDTAEYRKVAEPIGGNDSSAAATLGPGSVLALGNALGLGSGSVELFPSYRAPDTLVLPDSEPWELRPQVSGDPLQVLAGMTDYLNSPAALNAPPNNRFQQIIADLNGTLANVRAAVGFLSTQIEIQEGAGAVGRLVFRKPMLDNLDDIIENVERATANASATMKLVRASAAGDSVPGVVGNLVFGDGGDNLDSAMAAITAAAARGELLDLLLEASDEQAFTEVLDNVSAFTRRVRDLSRDLDVGTRSALDIVLGDREAQRLLETAMLQLEELGDTGRTIGLGIIGLVVVQILSGLFF